MEKFEQDIYNANKLQKDLLEKAMKGDGTNDILKALHRKAAAMGEIREFGGKKYQKGPNGWRLVKKGNSTKAVEEAKDSTVEQKKASEGTKTDLEKKLDIATKREEDFRSMMQKTPGGLSDENIKRLQRLGKIVDELDDKLREQERKSESKPKTKS